MRKILFALLLMLYAATVCAQTHTEVTIEDNQAISGAKTMPSINNIIYVDGVAIKTIAAAIAALPSAPIADTGNIYTYGTVMLPPNPSGYSVSSTITLSPFVKIVGSGEMESTFITCTAKPCFHVSNLPFTVIEGDGGFYNITLEGNGSNNQVGIAGTDTIGLTMDHVRVYGFTGTGAIGVSLTNASYWNERSHFTKLWLFHNTIGLALNVTGGTNSFGHQTWVDLQCNIENGQVCIQANNNATLYESLVTGVINTDSRGTYTAVQLTSTASVSPSTFLVINVDNSGGGSVYCVDTASGASFEPGGNMWGCSSSTGSGTVAAVLPAFTSPTTENTLLTPSAMSLGALSASNYRGVGAYLHPALSATFSSLGGLAFNLWPGLDGNWHTSGDGANNGGWAFLGTAGSGLPTLYSVPDVGGASRSIAPGSLTSLGVVATTTAAQTLSDKTLTLPIIGYYAIASLPSASSSGAGAIAVVTDALTYTPGTCTNGGSDYMIAVSNGSTWSCH